MSTPLEFALQFLRRHNPQALDELQATDNAATITLGGLSPETRNWRRSADVMKLALEQAVITAQAHLDKDRHALGLSRRWQLTSDVLGTLGPASIFTVLKSDLPSTAAYLSGALTLIAAIVTVVSHYLSRSPSRAMTLLDHYQELIDCRSRALALIRQFEVERHKINVDDRDRELLEQANEVCRRVDLATS